MIRARHDENSIDQIQHRQALVPFQERRHIKQHDVGFKIHLDTLKKIACVSGGKKLSAVAGWRGSEAEGEVLANAETKRVELAS
ncbi:MAG: hypothetical protein HKP40_10415 [Litoreibacter sp.]|nr:hypothetical protein [Litoreibacter sp.]